MTNSIAYAANSSAQSGKADARGCCRRFLDLVQTSGNAEVLEAPSSPLLAPTRHAGAV
jgi:hypothetical protein